MLAEAVADIVDWLNKDIAAKPWQANEQIKFVNGSTRPIQPQLDVFRFRIDDAAVMTRDCGLRIAARMASIGCRQCPAAATFWKGCFWGYPTQTKIKKL